VKVNSQGTKQKYVQHVTVMFIM